MAKLAYKLINGITLYRLVTAPVLVYLLLNQQFFLFQWLLPLSFFTDAIDGFFARRYKVASNRGAKLDSVADDLTILAAIAGIIVYRPGFLKEQWLCVTLMLVLAIVQTVLALLRYGKISSFHTYAAKTAAVLQGVFLILFFLLGKPVYPLFYTAAGVTMLDLLEEIFLVLLLPRWETNVKGLYWVLKRKKEFVPGTIK